MIRQAIKNIGMNESAPIIFKMKEEPSEADFEVIWNDLDGLDYGDGLTSDGKEYEFLPEDEKVASAMEKVFKKLKIKYKKEIDKSISDFNKLKPEKQVLKLYQSMITRSNDKPGGDERLVYKFGAANGSIWIESDYNASEVADFNKSGTYFGMTYPEMVKLVKSSKIKQAKRRI